MSGPLADLSYRHYGDGVVNDRAWWAIARNGFRGTVKKKGFWVLTAMSSWWYAVVLVMVYVFEQIAANSIRQQAQDRAVDFISSITWNRVILDGVSFGQIFYLFLALMAGAGAIANDNRTNALLVYLSKPCTKMDYLIGKWLGVFLPLVLAMLLPQVGFFFYGAMSYHDYGFLRQDPWLALKLPALAIIMAAFYASIVLGMSSLFNQGRLAGAISAAIYFITNFFTVLLGGIIAAGASMEPATQVTMPLKLAFYGSMDGMMIATAKGILGQDQGGLPLGGPQNNLAVPAIPIWIPLLVSFVVAGLLLFLAHTRVRAVEVVK